jgi:hypothetical protein
MSKKKKKSTPTQSDSMLNIQEPLNITPLSSPETPAGKAEPENIFGKHILIIDDSNQICSLLVSNIISQCSTIGLTVNLVQSSPLGMLVTMPVTFFNSNNTDSITIYTANSPKNALPVLRLHNLTNLTIVSDIMTPADTEVGLLGLLQTITEQQLNVNLVFCSSEGQNRYYVESLIKRGKAFFVEKGSEAWMELPRALVHRSEMFQYKIILKRDYDSGTSHEFESENKDWLGDEAKKRPWWSFLLFWKRF